MDVDKEKAIRMTTLKPKNEDTAITILVAVPLYRSSELIEPLFKALAGLGDELAALNGHVLLINDSPDDGPLSAAISAYLPALQDSIGVELLLNETNIGFVASANRALRLGQARHADVILLNSDAIPTSGAFAEMAEVARTDPMISVVSPRSNNATICNSPYPDHFRALPHAAALRAHRAIQPYLPRISYVPTAVGFCLYVRRLMIEEFGVFDDIYGAGYNEENDFIMRCNLAGYRAVLANHAFVFHLGSVSFKTTNITTENREFKNSLILGSRYPHYGLSIRRYFAGAEFRTQWLLAGLVPDARGRLRLLFDGRNIGAFHCGTFEHARGLITAFVDAHGQEFSIHLVCKSAVATFHGFDLIDGLSVCEPDAIGDNPFAIIFRIAQPFSLSHLTELGDLAPLTGFLFLDTIAMDCLALDADHLCQIWDLMSQSVALIGFNSQFTERQFRSRFILPYDVVDFVSLCSTDVSEYKRRGPARVRPSYILVVGNHYAHKHVAQTVSRLQAQTDRSLVVLGGDEVASDARTKIYRAGDLEQSLVDDLYDGASVVVFPSHYEGFGLPILHALARGKPIIARDTPPAREIKSVCPEAINLHLYETTDEMVQAAAQDIAWQEPRSPAKPWGWADAAKALRDAMVKAVERCDYASVHARVVRLQLLDRVTSVAEVRSLAPSLLPTAASPDQLCDWAAGTLRAAAEAGRLELAAIGGSPRLASGRISILAQDDGDSDDRLMIRLLEAAEQMEDDALIVLGVDDEPLKVLRTRLLLISAGFAPGRAGAAGGQVAIVARLFVRWTDTVDLGGEDAAFVESAYRAALGRPSEPEERTYHLDVLAKGLERRTLLLMMFTSRERLSLVAKMHGCALDSASAISPRRRDTELAA